MRISPLGSCLLSIFPSPNPAALNLRNLKYFPHPTWSFKPNQTGSYRFPPRFLKLWSPNLGLHLPHSHPSPLGSLWMPARNTCWRQRKFTCNRYPAGVKPTLRFQGHFPPHLLPHQRVSLSEADTGNYCESWVPARTIWNHVNRPDDCYLPRCSPALPALFRAALGSWPLWHYCELQDGSTGSFCKKIQQVFKQSSKYLKYNKNVPFASKKSLLKLKKIQRKPKSHSFHFGNNQVHY